MVTIDLLPIAWWRLLGMTHRQSILSLVSLRSLQARHADVSGHPRVALDAGFPALRAAGEAGHAALALDAGIAREALQTFPARQT